MKYKINYCIGVWITNSSEVNNTIENEAKNNKPPSYNSCMRLDNFVTGKSYLLNILY